MNKTLKAEVKNKQNGDLTKKTQPTDGAVYSFRLIIAIIERGGADNIVDVLSKKFNTKFHITCQGDGTADSAILQLLNLDKSLKDVVICVTETAKCSEMVKAIYDAYEGGGVVFSIKLNSIGGMRALKLLKGDFGDMGNKSIGDKKE